MWEEYKRRVGICPGISSDIIVINILIKVSEISSEVSLQLNLFFLFIAHH